MKWNSYDQKRVVVFPHLMLLPVEKLIAEVATWPMTEDRIWGQRALFIHLLKRSYPPVWISNTPFRALLLTKSNGFLLPALALLKQSVTIAQHLRADSAMAYRRTLLWAFMREYFIFILFSLDVECHIQHWIPFSFFFSFRTCFVCPACSTSQIGGGAQCCCISNLHTVLFRLIDEGSSNMFEASDLDFYHQLGR